MIYINANCQRKRVLKQFSPMKIQLISGCILALKKRKIPPSCKRIRPMKKINEGELIYSVDQSEQ